VVDEQKRHIPIGDSTTYTYSALSEGPYKFIVEFILYVKRKRERKGCISTEGITTRIPKGKADPHQCRVVEPKRRRQEQNYR
jgi:hypothetical protein